MKSYKDILKATAKEKYGSKYGLYLYNAERRAKALLRESKGAFIPQSIAKSNELDYITFGILTGQAKYKVSYKDLKSNATKAITIARITPLAEEFNKDVEIVKNGKTVIIQSIKSALEDYKDDIITLEELEEIIEEYKKSNEYLYRGYE